LSRIKKGAALVEKPKVADTKPAIVTLEAGTYWWCQCGLSSTQPFCDGSHKDTAFGPLKMEVEKSKRVALCLCKATEAPPLCDGSHAMIEEE
jgi:CDGSH-type Zn-finger protein